MIKLYETNSFIKECTARVISCEEKNNLVYIKLDESIFFPEEGGQYADTGLLEYVDANGENNSVKLLDGQIVDGAIIYQTDHKIDINTEVLCKLDWAKRFDRMQNHSGEHILSGLINRKFGYNNVGFHLSDDDAVTLCMDGILSKEQLLELESEVNAIIYEDLPITDSYPSKEELGNISYRSKIEIEGQVRLITIGDDKQTVDICACCAPHVRTTGQIGILKVTSVTKFKSGVQISILCGRRALEYINHNLDTLNTLSGAFSTHPDNLPAIIDSLKKDNQAVKSELSDYKEKAIIEGIVANPQIRCIFSNNQLSAQNMKNIYNVLVENCTGYVGLFEGSDEEGYRYYAGGNGLNARELANLMREALGAKGGGSEEMIQGKTDADRMSIEDFWKKL